MDQCALQRLTRWRCPCRQPTARVPSFACCLVVSSTSPAVVHLASPHSHCSGRATGIVDLPVAVPLPLHNRFPPMVAPSPPSTAFDHIGHSLVYSRSSLVAWLVPRSWRSRVVHVAHPDRAGNRRMPDLCLERAAQSHSRRRLVADDAVDIVGDAGSAAADACCLSVVLLAPRRHGNALGMLLMAEIASHPRCACPHDALLAGSVAFIPSPVEQEIAVTARSFEQEKEVVRDAFEGLAPSAGISRDTKASCRASGPGHALQGSIQLHPWPATICDLDQLSWATSATWPHRPSRTPICSLGCRDVLVLH